MKEFTDVQTAAVAGGIFGAILVAAFACALVVLVLRIIANWKIFEKAGEKGWKSLIPIYCDYISYKITRMVPWFWVLIVCGIVGGFIVSSDVTFTEMLYNQEEFNFETFDVSQHLPAFLTEIVTCILSTIVGIIYAWRLKKAFKKSTGFFVGLLLLPSIFWLILAFGDSKYDKNFLK